MLVEVPEGFWERGASHSPEPWTPMLGSVFFDVRDAALRELFATFGLLVETGVPPDRREGPATAAGVADAVADADRARDAQADPRSPGTVSGIAAVSGRYTGPVRIVRDDTEIGRIRPVTSWSARSLPRGVVGGDAERRRPRDRQRRPPVAAAIIAREYGIAAVVATGSGRRRCATARSSQSTARWAASRCWAEDR